MTRAGLSGASTTGLLGPVSVSAGLILLFASPMVRGGNRHAVLMALEALGIVLLLCIWIAWVTQQHGPRTKPSFSTAALWLLLLSPVILAAVYLTPVPMELWATTPGRALYLDAVRDAGAQAAPRLPLSLLPAATMASLLAGIPLVAAFLLGRHSTVRQLRQMAWLVVGIALAEVVLGVLQIAGGLNSPLYFGAPGGRPIGTFANSNHFANYLAIALLLYIWLGYASLVTHRTRAAGPAGSGRHGHSLAALWGGGGLLLVVGILLSRSRGAVLTGLLMAAVALACAVSMGRRRHSGWRETAVVLIAVIGGATALLGVDTVLNRFSSSELATSASFRGVLAQTTLSGAAEFWPWGAGWGSFAAVYPRFQPTSIPGAAVHAHQDYAQMLFEGGIFFVLFAAAFLWLTAGRALTLARLPWQKDARKNPDAVAALFCGLGLLGFLLHSLVEFNMHIPVNAILAALLAGVYLRPLADTPHVHDRPAQSHPARN